MGCGGLGVLAWFRVWVRAVSLGLASLRLWCYGLRGVMLVVVLRLVVRSFRRRGRVLGWRPVGGGGGPRSGGVRAPVPGGGFPRCAAGVPGSPVRGLGGPR